jgi:type IV secretion system protein VirB6
LAGGASMAALTIRQMVSPAAATARVVNPTSNRLDPKTGLQTSSGRAEHLYMGRSILNPAYRKAVTDHRTENHGKNTVQRK